MTDDQAERLIKAIEDLSANLVSAMQVAMTPPMTPQELSLQNALRENVTNPIAYQYPNTTGRVR